MRTGHLVGLSRASSSGTLPVSGVPRQVTTLTSWAASDRLSGQANSSQSWPTWQARLPYAGKDTRSHWLSYLACIVQDMYGRDTQKHGAYVRKVRDTWPHQRQYSLLMVTRR